MGTHLTQISTGALESLLSRLKGERLQQPLSAKCVAEVKPLIGLSRAEARRLIECVLAERATQPPAPELVWTGPAPVNAATLDTGVTLKWLFERAKTRVIVAGYCFDHGKEIFEPLHRAMAERGVTVDFFVHVPIKDADRPKLKTDTGRAQVIEKGLMRFLAQNWPGEPFPRLHYDPRPVTDRLYSSLHAKCVVVDDAEALVTSANFTSRAQERNVEVGVLIKDPRFVKSLAAQWHTARAHGMFLTYGGAG